MKKDLTENELKALESIGVVAKNWYAVSYNGNSMPFALFKNELIAEAYRNKFCITAIIEPWPMIERDYRKPRKSKTETEQLKEENQRLETMLEKSGEALSIATDENERLKAKPFYEQFINAYGTNQKLILEIDSLKQLNSELVEGIKSVIYARNQYTFFLDGYKNGSASISEVTKASKDENKAFESLISKLNP